ncbi:hypothetical protein OS493_039416, partial [Desmophyllum pertusum]
MFFLIKDFVKSLHGKDDFPCCCWTCANFLFFEVSVISDDKKLSIKADRCYATPTSGSEEFFEIR